MCNTYYPILIVDAFACLPPSSKADTGWKMTWLQRRTGSSCREVFNFGMFSIFQHPTEPFVFKPAIQHQLLQSPSRRKSNRTVKKDSQNHHTDSANLSVAKLELKKILTHWMASGGHTFEMTGGAGSGGHFQWSAQNQLQVATRPPSLKLWAPCSFAVGFSGKAGFWLWKWQFNGIWLGCSLDVVSRYFHIQIYSV